MMEFDCKIATRNEIKRISGFNSIKELYQRVSQTFLVPINQILFCTVNTHNSRDMNALLGNYLSVGDLIVVHMCGKTKSLNLRKTQEYLGLTITDNGHGRAFIKKIKSGDGSLEEVIRPGDHISAINSDSTLGMRHFEVAKAIRELPQNIVFSIQLVEPLYEGECKFNRLPELLRDNEQYLDTSKTHLDSDGSDISETGYDDLINSSLPFGKLLSKSAQSMGSQDNSSKEPARLESKSYRVRIDAINSILESFLGISDNVLAVQIYRTAMDSDGSFENFVNTINSSDLNVLNFGNEIKAYLWRSATDQMK